MARVPVVKVMERDLHINRKTAQSLLAHGSVKLDGRTLSIADAYLPWPEVAGMELSVPTAGRSTRLGLPSAVGTLFDV